MKLRNVIGAIGLIMTTVAIVAPADARPYHHHHYHPRPHHHWHHR
jgi:hypothetical protein